MTRRLRRRFGPTCTPTIAALWLVVLLSGCLGSKNPITPPESATLDERLLGAWVTTELYYNETVFMHVMQQGGSAMMDVYEIRHNESGTGSESSAQGHVSILGDRHFLNLQGPSDATPTVDAPRYTFVAYEFDRRGDLIVHLLSEQDFGEAFKDGRLDGKVEMNADFVATLISDSSERLAGYLASADTAALHERQVTFHKLVPPQ